MIYELALRLRLHAIKLLSRADRMGWTLFARPESAGVIATATLILSHR
jgi:hypothetical protein